jgi:hypothetical protein
MTAAEGARHVFMVAADRSFWTATIFLAATLLLVAFAIKTRKPEPDRAEFAVEAEPALAD